MVTDYSEVGNERLITSSSQQKNLNSIMSSVQSSTTFKPHDFLGPKKSSGMAASKTLMSFNKLSTRYSVGQSDRDFIKIRNNLSSHQ